MGSCRRPVGLPVLAATGLRQLPAAGPVPPGPAAWETDVPLARHHRRLHCIEDNETNVEPMRGILAQRAQIVLSVSMPGLDGLDDARPERTDLILLDMPLPDTQLPDMQLPDISGLELLRHLEQDERLGDIPVVARADATPASIERALAIGAAHDLTRPVSVTDFLSMIDRRLDAIDTQWGRCRWATDGMETGCRPTALIRPSVRHPLP